MQTDDLAVDKRSGGEGFVVWLLNILYTWNIQLRDEKEFASMEACTHRKFIVKHHFQNPTSFLKEKRLVSQINQMITLTMVTRTL